MGRSIYTALVLAVGHLGLVPVALASPLQGREAAPAPLRYGRDIRPILAEHCFACHGPDKAKRKGGLRLDTQDGALADHGGGPVVIPGKPRESEVWKRLVHTDPDERMPPTSTGKALKPAEITRLERWIAEGARYEAHWAYTRVERPPVPELPGVSPPVPHPVDRFIVAELVAAGITPAPVADPITLARRLHLDLLGLPPRPADVDAFVADVASPGGLPGAVERLADRLLASPHFGERLAIPWLDLVRYADSIGFHSDNERQVWPYRDWVIEAFNGNKRFDRFTIEQLAGDLLPGAGVKARVASTYNMLLLTTEEGGAQAKEYEAKMAADRVRNLGDVWLGSTVGCAQCHDHKYDPFTLRDFYRLSAFFADLKEDPILGRGQHLLLLSPEQEQALARVDQDLARARWEHQAPKPAIRAAQRAWETWVQASLHELGAPWRKAEPTALAAEGGTQLKWEDKLIKAEGPTPDREVLSVDLAPDAETITGLRLEVHGLAAFINKGYARAGDGDIVLTGVEVFARDDAGSLRPVPLRAAVADFEAPGHPARAVLDRRRKTGWALGGQRTPPESRYAPTRSLVLAFTRPVPAGARLHVRLRQESPRHPQRVLARFAFAVTSFPDPTRAGPLPQTVVMALRLESRDRDPQQQRAVDEQFREMSPLLARTRARVRVLEARRFDLLSPVGKTLHAIPAEPRQVRVLPRGNWMDDTGEVVTPAVPEFLPPIDKPWRQSRLDLARWLVSRDNPLTARVFVNRLWRLFFGQGLVRTMEDMGAQGDPPTHPALLDWLAAEFMEAGWDIKRLVRLLVTSEAYRRSSVSTPALLAADPENRLLTRQVAFRLEAELVRDAALAVSGLLSPHVGGPSVKPYQPEGYWDALNFPKRTWTADLGDKGRRRGLYTHWQRTFLHPALLAFDAPTREECTAARSRSNTPQQALVLLNDPSYTEAARALAARIVVEGGRTDEERIAWAFRQATGRRPSTEEIAKMAELRRRHGERYAQEPQAARALIAVGDLPSVRTDPATLAAWTSVSRAIFNLYETNTRN